MSTKLCMKCLREKPLSEFYTKPTGGLVARRKCCLTRTNNAHRSALRAAKRATRPERPQANNINPRPLLDAMGQWR